MLLALSRPAFGQASSISGIVVDAVGGVVSRASITLSLEDGGPARETVSNDAGEFVFADVSPGAYRLSIRAEGFSSAVVPIAVRAGEAARLAPTILTVAAFSSEIDVTPSQAAIADAQIKVAEKQRVLGVFPNYFASYEPDAAPLNVRQKFELSWKSLLDPVTFVTVGVEAGIGQARNTNPGFGSGWEGYAKRYAATYAEVGTRRIIAKVVMPTVFSQDPRYFYKGTGTTRSRLAYAVSRSVICRGDDKRSQFCYSSILGRLASGALANLYLPPSDRNSAQVVLENVAIATAGNAVGNILQEFVFPRLTPKKP